MLRVWKFARLLVCLRVKYFDGEETFGFSLTWGFILEPNVETTFVGTEVGTAIRKHI